MTAEKREAEGGESLERPKKAARSEAGKDASSTSRSSSRRAVKSALIRYSRMGASALAAAQRAQVLLRRVAGEWAAMGERLASMPEASVRESKFETRFAPGLMAEALARAAAAAASWKSGGQEKKPSKEELALRVDALGREVDAEGRVVAPGASRRTLLANENLDKKGEKRDNPYAAHRMVEAADALDIMDPRLVARKRETKKARAFAFVEEGHYVKIAEATRQRAAGISVDEVGDDVGEQPESAAVEAVLPRRPDHVASVPGMEWWDEEFLPKEARAKRLSSVAERMRDQYELCGIEHSRFYGLVHHPPAAKPLAPEKRQAETMPFYLTKQDRKRVRRQTRAEREREKRDKIQLGLVPPPEPKFKLSNFMKVLGEQAVANPSKLEKKVMEQVNQRLQHHEMRNAARKLTPQERKDKKRRKLAEDTSHEVFVAVFYVHNLDSSQHRFKLDVNAKQLNLTGAVLMCTSPEAHFSLVVVEGGPKGLRRFVALVTRRIRWTDDDAPTPEAAAAPPPNWAVLIWRGTVAKRAFSQFKFQECRTAFSARRVLEAKAVPHYWDLALQRHEKGPPQPDEIQNDDDDDEADA